MTHPLLSLALLCLGAAPPGRPDVGQAALLREAESLVAGMNKAWDAGKHDDALAIWRRAMDLELKVIGVLTQGRIESLLT